MQINNNKKYSYYHENNKNFIIYRFLTIFLLFNFFKISYCFDINNENGINANGKEINVNINENKHYGDRLVFKASKQSNIEDIGENEYLIENIEADNDQSKKI